LIPGVEHTEEADLGAEMFGIASDFEEGCGTGLQQKMVQEFLVLEGERRQFRSKPPKVPSAVEKEDPSACRPLLNISSDDSPAHVAIYIASAGVRMKGATGTRIAARNGGIARSRNAPLEPLSHATLQAFVAVFRAERGEEQRRCHISR
jgi:hypothetical protein